MTIADYSIMPSVFSTSFKRRLFLASTGFFLLVIFSATAVYLATRQYSEYLARNASAQRVYSSYLTVSDHTYRKLNAMGEIVADGDLFDIEERYRNQRALVQALEQVRNNVISTPWGPEGELETQQLDHFNRIEAVAEEIIRGSEIVRDSVSSNNREQAIATLELMRSAEIEGKFNGLIDTALAEQLREVQETQRVATELNGLLIKLLPLLVIFFLIFGALVFNAIWQALNRSLKTFELAAQHYRNGDFDYRINKIEEAEFSDLAVAFNHMASELESERERERVSQENLESLIRERTGELEHSNAKLETVSEARKQFLTDISHELRTPLTIIQGESDFALRGDVKTPDQYIDALTRVREQAIHTTRLVQDLLFVARTEDGKAPTHMQSMAIVPIVQEICSDFRALSAERNITIEEIHTDPNIVGNIDAGRIRQVIVVLLDNALRYSHKDSTITVKVQSTDQHIVLEVSDTGVGLRYQEANLVFSRFYRGNEGVGAPTGTGLGLPVAKAIVDAHGGSISLDGEQGRGTTATVLLPLQRQLRAIQ